MKLHHIFLCGLALGLAAVGCSSDDKEDTGSGGFTLEDCQAIITACHEKDDYSGGEISVCHEDAHEAEHSGDYSQCDRDRCVALCDAAEHPGAGGAGGHHNHTGGTGGSHDHTGGTGGHMHAGGAAGHMHDE